MIRAKGPVSVCFPDFWIKAEFKNKGDGVVGLLKVNAPALKVELVHAGDVLNAEQIIFMMRFPMQNCFQRTHFCFRFRGRNYKNILMQFVKVIGIVTAKVVHKPQLVCVLVCLRGRFFLQDNVMAVSAREFAPARLF